MTKLATIELTEAQVEAIGALMLRGNCGEASVTALLPDGTTRTLRVVNVTEAEVLRLERSERATTERNRRLIALGCHAGSHVTAIRAAAEAVLHSRGLAHIRSATVRQLEYEAPLLSAAAVAADIAESIDLPIGFDARPAVVTSGGSRPLPALRVTLDLVTSEIFLDYWGPKN